MLVHSSFQLKEVDAVAFPQALDPYTSSVVDFTTAVTTGTLFLVQPMPKMESRVFAVVNPFETKVYFFLFLHFFLRLINVFFSFHFQGLDRTGPKHIDSGFRSWYI